MLPQYVSREFSRHGKERLYYRKNGLRVRLFKPVGTREFNDEIVKADQTLKKRPPEPIKGFVYFVVFGKGKVKIGKANDPKRRFNDIRAGIPGAAKLLYTTPGGRALERSLHQKFAVHRLSGEWFVFAQDIKDWIAMDEHRRIGGGA